MPAGRETKGRWLTPVQSAGGKARQGAARASPAVAARMPPAKGAVWAPPFALGPAHGQGGKQGPPTGRQHASKAAGRVPPRARLRTARRQAAPAPRPHARISACGAACTRFGPRPAPIAERRGCRRAGFGGGGCQALGAEKTLATARLQSDTPKQAANQTNQLGPERAEEPFGRRALAGAGASPPFGRPRRPPAGRRVAAPVTSSAVTSRASVADAHLLGEGLLVVADVAGPRLDGLLLAHPDLLGHLVDEPEVVGHQHHPPLVVVDGLR